MNPMPTTAAGLASEAAAVLSQLETWADSLSSAERRQWVVIAAHDIPLCFDVDGESIANPRSCRIDAATRFVRGRAQRIAAMCENGKGEPALAFPLQIAAERAIESMRETVAMFERAAAEQRAA